MPATFRNRFLTIGLLVGLGGFLALAESAQANGYKLVYSSPYSAYHLGYHFTPPVSAYTGVRVRPIGYGVPAYYHAESYLPAGSVAPQNYYHYYAPDWRRGYYFLSAHSYWPTYPY